MPSTAHGGLEMRLGKTSSSLACLVFASSLAVMFVTEVQAAEFKYNSSVSVKVGKSVVLKGARGKTCDDGAPSWAEVASNLPKTTTGTYSDGGVGTTQSQRCGKSVPARGIKFTATTAGKERLQVYGDPVSITAF
jgi:hypothetical protein